MKKILFVALGLFAASLVWTQDARSLFDKGVDLERKAQWFEATDYYREALELNPQFSEAWFNLARCSYNLGTYELCLEYCETALKYSNDYSVIMNLKGMAFIALGRLDDAKKIFTDVLSRYPNDIDSRFGLAELELYDGKISTAKTLFTDALKRDETNRKALLSLALISFENGNSNAAEEYIRQAMNYHSGQCEVHYLASYLAFREGKLNKAEQRARSAVQINGQYDKAYGILAQILYAQKRYDEAIDICDFRISRNRSLSDAWYLRGLCELKQNKSDKAIETFTTGLSVDPQDEIMRLVFEQLVFQGTELEDPRRDSWAEFHYNKAKEFGRNFDGPSERYEFQKAVSISPMNLTFRQDFAKMLERDGSMELYLQQLKFIQSLSQPLEDDDIQRNEDSPKVIKTKQQIENEDTIEALETLMQDNLSHKWNIDPFYLDKSRWNIGIYYMKNSVQLIHPNMEEILCNGIRDSFNGMPSCQVQILDHGVDSYSEAFRHARNNKLDYFVIWTVQETSRTFSIEAKIYSARTGTKTSDLFVYRTGNDRVAKSIQRMRQGISSILPIRGKVLNVSQGEILLDLGKNDAVVPGCEFDVVKSGSILTKDTGPGIFFNEKNLLGKLTVVKADEEISEGDFKKNGFYDILNSGDEVILTKSPSDSDSQDGSVALDARPQADADGNIATENAKKAQKEAIKESLKVQARENNLINMIREIL